MKWSMCPSQQRLPITTSSWEELINWTSFLATTDYCGKLSGTGKLYHLLEIVTTNSSILYNWQRMEANEKKRSQTEFRDRLVQQMISKYGKPAPPPQNYTINHGSCYSTNLENKWCALCHTQKTKEYARIVPTSLPYVKLWIETAIPSGTRQTV